MQVDFVVLFTKCANAGFSIKKLMREAGISKTTWTRIKEGKTIQTATLGKIAAALGVDPAELLIKGGK